MNKETKGSEEPVPLIREEESLSENSRLSSMHSVIEEV